jgi:hypothetical protein
MKRGQERINSFIGSSTNEFLRFNDLKPGTSRQPFWFFAAWLVFIWALLALIRWLIEVVNPQWNQFGTAITGAVFAFFIIPTSALLIRRLSHVMGLGSIVTAILQLDRHGTWGKLGVYVIGLFFALLFAFVWSVAPLVTLAVLALAALVPGRTHAIPRPELSLNSPSGYAKPPTLSAPPMTPSAATQFPPPRGPFAVPVPLVFFSAQPSPSKALLKRFGFWLSVLLFLLALLIPFQDQAQTFIDDTFQNTNTVPVPLILETTTSPPVVTPTESPTTIPTTSDSVPEPVATDSVGLDVTTGVDDDDGGIVAVIPAADDENNLDPRFRYCTHAIGSGYGPYYAGIDPEYAWYTDRDRDGIVCER